LHNTPRESGFILNLNKEKKLVRKKLRFFSLLIKTHDKMMSVIIENITILELKIKKNVQTKRFILKTKSDLKLDI